jgi:hypothetical protein
MVLFALLTLFTAMGGYWLSQAMAAGNSSQGLGGTIVYVADGNEIRMVEADGSNDRSVWVVPDPVNDAITGVSWKPDRTGFAFTSTQETECSLRRADLYTIHNNGTGLKKITDGPLCADLAAYPQGTVTVQVQNFTPGVNVVFVYVQGAASAQQVNISPGTAVNVTFTDVADFGPGFEQQVIASAGIQSWLNPLARADVVAGSTVDAGEVIISNGYKIEDWAVMSPSWRRDGAAIGFTVGGGIGMYQITPNPGIAVQGDQILVGGSARSAGAMAFSPVSNEVLFYEDPYIYIATPGQAGEPEALVELTAVFGGLAWYPDGSGFVVSEFSTFLEYGDLYEYTFADSTLTPLTANAGEYAFHPSISPDGEHILYSHYIPGDDSATLRIRNRDGSQDWALGVNGEHAAWSGPAVSPPEESSLSIYIPFLNR